MLSNVGFSEKTRNQNQESQTLNRFLVNVFEVSDQSGGGTPVPIPNTEVKPSSDMESTVHQSGKSRTLLTIVMIIKGKDHD